jgi:hypothetical protein
VVLTHGEERQRAALAALMDSRFGVAATQPKRFQVIEL